MTINRPQSLACHLHARSVGLLCKLDIMTLACLHDFYTLYRHLLPYVRALRWKIYLKQIDNRNWLHVGVIWLNCTTDWIPSKYSFTLCTLNSVLWYNSIRSHQYVVNYSEMDVRSGIIYQGKTIQKVDRKLVVNWDQSAYFSRYITWQGWYIRICVA